jgi:hypothetical protein
MGIFDTFGTDTDAEQSGRWFEIAPGVRFQLRRLGGANKAFERFIEKAVRDRSSAYETASLSIEENRALTREAIVTLAVVGWEGVTDEEGEPLPFSEANLRMIFDSLPEVYGVVERIVQDWRRFKRAGVESAAGN